MSSTLVKLQSALSIVEKEVQSIRISCDKKAEYLQSSEYTQEDEEIIAHTFQLCIAIKIFIFISSPCVDVISESEKDRFYNYIKYLNEDLLKIEEDPRIVSNLFASVSNLSKMIFDLYRYNEDD